MNPYLDIRPEVAAALACGGPVVALESTVISHGLPRPNNLETARRIEAAVRKQGAVPATVGLSNGRLIVGLSDQEVELLANADGVHKVSRRDLSAVLQTRKLGATTVAATILIASQAGISVFATGGIGGVHRGVQETLDISADLTELARTPVAIVCAGAKIILDLPRTLELLETLGVPVVGYRTSSFPAFYVRESGLGLDLRVDSPEEAAELMCVQSQLGLSSGIVFCNPPPEESSLDRTHTESLIEAALASAHSAGIRGKAVTPYLLSYLSQASGRASLKANIELLVNNAGVAAQIAVARSALHQS
ncbi:MAG TPA: pseudouridine-5'-phosphate glycosidase [Candidatus Sulfotelmatobacter sp.]|nr:pseudouridine-5'-phosphate glycosidase [Candidatus Sulfotelmatobacter sp.]